MNAMNCGMFCSFLGPDSSIITYLSPHLFWGCSLDILDMGMDANTKFWKVFVEMVHFCPNYFGPVFISYQHLNITAWSLYSVLLKNSIRPLSWYWVQDWYCPVWDRYIIGIETDIKLLQDWYYIRSRWCTGLRLVSTLVATTPGPYQVSITWGNTSHVPIPNQCNLAHTSMYYWYKIGNILIPGASLYTKPTPVWSSWDFACFV